MLGAGLKAGIIVGIVVAVIALVTGVAGISANPIIGLLNCCLSLVIPALWFVSGILAARFGPADMTAGAAAGGGAVGGAITQTIGGVVSVVVSVIMQFLAPVTARIPPDLMRDLVESGFPPEVISMMQSTAGPLGNCMCCVGLGVAIAAGLGAVGGIVGRAMKR